MRAQAALSILVIVTACDGYRAPNARAFPPTVATRGETIYFGDVFPLGEDAPEPAFVYERRVAETEGGAVSTHITRRASGEVALAESARHDRDYELVEYTLHTNQIGQSGSVRVDAGEVSFRLSDGDAIEEATEHVSDPVVVGPTLVGYAMRHLDALREGETLTVRLAILDRLETVGFELSAIESDANGTTVEMAPSSVLVSLALDPIELTFDDARKLVRLEGRVPPRIDGGEAWSDLDARVEYRYASATYR
jgi:hypothetical protein